MLAVGVRNSEETGWICSVGVESSEGECGKKVRDWHRSDRYF